MSARGRGLCACISQHAISYGTTPADCDADAHAYANRDTHAHTYVYPKPHQHAYRHADCDADRDARSTQCHACSTVHTTASPAHGYTCATDRDAGAGPAPVRACAATRTGVRHVGRFLGWGCRVGPGIA